MIEDRESDNLLYEYVLTELENGIVIKALWAKAMAKAEGNENKIQSLYMQFRVQNIKDQFTKLQIAYDRLTREQLFQKIKSQLFFDSAQQSSHDSDTTVQIEKKEENYTDKRLKEIDHALVEYRSNKHEEKKREEKLSFINKLTLFFHLN